MANQFSRRRFIKRTAIVTGGILLAPNFISCNNDDDGDSATINTEGFIEQNFNEGVASFDPTTSQVIIWTRYTSASPSPEITWQLSTDQNFEVILRQGTVTTDTSRDFTVAVEVQDLESGQKLYYRFLNVEDNAISVVGETLTFAESGIDEVTFAVTSCANYAAGLFNVYREMANSDADVIIHLGDYIYEYGQGEYGTNASTAALGRTPDPLTETISLDEYRTRYRQYRSDENLQLAHQKKPFIAVWDDHEITNDAYDTGAENHQPDEGSFEVRKQAALQAYSEFMPTKTNNEGLIYRSFQIGNIVDLIMLDTRLVGRTRQLDYANYTLNDGSIDAVAFQSDWLDTSRTMLGSTQLNWLLGEMSSSTAGWQVIGQQVLMARMFIPAELLGAFGAILAEIAATGAVSDATFNAFNTSLTQLVELKLRANANDPTLTQDELARINTIVPYNLDAWDGYPTEREVILNAFAGKNVAILSGDTHNAWQSDVKDAQGNVRATEFASSSVSSPGFEGFIGTDAATVAGFEQAITILIDDLNYVDASQRGYVEVTFTASSATSRWVYVSDIFSESYNSFIGHTAQA